METFDCLKADCPILGPHLLEASAGTGKTFAIEHVVARLLLEEKEIELEEILAITFTRAAARDLKARIHSNLQKVLLFFEKGEFPWEYLKSYEDQDRAKQKIRDALSLFDRAQIFTIHGFCYRMLQEFALEAGLSFSLPDPDALVKPPRKVAEIRSFLEEKISGSLLSKEQARLLLKKNASWKELIWAMDSENSAAGAPFIDLERRFSQVFQGLDFSEKKLQEDFALLAPCYKKGKGDLISQVSALAKQDFSLLLAEQGTLFSFLCQDNEKIKAKKPSSLHYPTFWNETLPQLALIAEDALDTAKMLALLRKCWREEDEELSNPDQIIEKMLNALCRRSFFTNVQKKYKAVIIDEFQDTDPIQWNILQTLFFSSNLLAFYLVGDPKQSIYRFRKADVYTYFDAKEKLGEKAIFSLKTNFRSSPALIDCLNALFTREWLPLPKLKKIIPCPAVKPGNKGEIVLDDEKGAIHFLMGGADEEFLLYALQKIEKHSFASFAILVKDRFQMEGVLQILKLYGIAARAKSPLPLGKTTAFQAIYELFSALAFPLDSARARIVLLGPYVPLLSDETRKDLQTLGLVPLCRKLLDNFLIEEWKQDMKRIVEELLQWENRHGFSFQGVLRFLEEFRELDVDEGGFRPVDGRNGGIEVLTIHGSKGLEFDAVFLLGAAARQQEVEDEEIEAEKFRQLYVAMTRAKKRLYIPIDPQRKNSLICRFIQKVEEQEGPFSTFVETQTNMTFEELPIVSPTVRKANEKQKEELPIIPPISPILIRSFTMLAQKSLNTPLNLKEEKEGVFTPHTLPAGVETGLIIHRIFEILFSSSTPTWKDAHLRKAVIEEELKATSLIPWTQAIEEMVEKTLHFPLFDDFSLIQLEPTQIQTEMQFLFPESPHYLTGFIDLVFLHKEKIYFVDWKTNWLGNSDRDYLDMTSAMHSNDYYLQASIYKEALERAFSNVKRLYIYGGAFYLFIRGGGVCRL